MLIFPIVLPQTIFLRSSRLEVVDHLVILRLPRTISYRLLILLRLENKGRHSHVARLNDLISYLLYSALYYNLEY